MNNLEQASRLAASFPQQSDLLQSRSVYPQLQSEMRADLSVKNSLPMRRHGYGLAEDTGRRFVTVQTTVPKFGLSDSLSGQLTISCFVSAAIPQTKPRRTDGFSYMKNGILVHHTERAITSKDVENALAEE